MGRLSNFGSSKYREFRNTGLSHSEAFQKVGALLSNKLQETRPQEFVSSPISKNTVISKKDYDFVKNAPNYKDLPMNRKGGQNAL